MRTINCFADIVGARGFAIHARNFFTALNRMHPVCLIPKFGPLPTDGPETPMGQMLARLASIDLHAPAINLDAAEEMFRFGGARRIGFTVFEGTRISAAGVHQLAQLDQVWVPTQWGASVLRDCGVPSEKIRVVPEGIDPDIFHPNITPFPELTNLGGCRFLSVGKWETRKNFPDLLRAFDRAFTDTDDVWLILHATSDVRAVQHIKPAEEIDQLGLRLRRRIITIDAPLQSDHDIARLYNSCDAFATATKAEGWGLPILEAMACGLPTIAPFHSGPTAFMTHENSYPLAVNAFEEIFCPTFYPDRGEHGVWAKIDIDALATQLRTIYDHRPEAHEIGASAARDIQSRFTWDHAAQIAQRWIDELPSDNL